jgi:undecaprenyldiphospho-muramoylpentapeptide beta-N-acetylglucosaminyltransferase
MRILFACGGTAGHINPAIAIADTLRADNAGVQVLFAGNPNGMEATLVPKAGYDFVPIEVDGLQRKLSWTNIKRNARAAARLAGAGKKAHRIIKDFAPDIVMGTGGYVSAPVVYKAAQMGIKTLTHEQNAFPGLTTKFLCRRVDKVLLAVAAAKAHLPAEKNYIVTGNPIRTDILFADRAAARAKLGIGGRVCVLSYGGSLGAQQINEAMAEVIATLLPEQRTHHIHATGRYGTEQFPLWLRERGIDPDTQDHLDVREYIDDMPDCLAAADLVICRSGAISLSELEAAGKASILVPSPNVAENHQYHNAMVLANKNAAIVVEEKDLTGSALAALVRDLVSDPQELLNLGKNAASLAVIDANRRICSEILSLYAQPSAKS